MSLYLDVPYVEHEEAKALGARWNPEIKEWYVDMQPDEYVKFAKWIIKDTAKDTRMSLYLDVPYAEHEEAKALGARWNPEIKKWYVDTLPDEYMKFAKWIAKDTAKWIAKDTVKDIDSIVIARNNLYVIEGIQNCYYCKSPIRVIGLGLGEFIELYWEEKKNKCQYAQYTDTYGKRIYLMWMQCEKNIPPKLLKYLKENYSVETLYSQARDEYCFANYCVHCGKLQGNEYIFNKIESPLIPYVSGKDELKEKISKMTVKKISLKDDLRLVCDRYIDSTRYLKYGQLEELDLSTDPENKGVSYEELYFLEQG